METRQTKTRIDDFILTLSLIIVCGSIMVELDTLFARRSIRKFTPKPVSDENIKKLLEAAMAAPSAGNRKPWHFLVTTKRETLDKLAEKHPYANMLYEAPLCIAVCDDPSVRRPTSPASFPFQDCAAATMNILHAAVGLELGAVWLGLGSEALEDMVRELFGVPGNILPISLVAIGHPAERKEPRTQYDETHIHKEKW